MRTGLVLHLSEEFGGRDPVMREGVRRPVWAVLAVAVVALGILLMATRAPAAVAATGFEVDTAVDDGALSACTAAVDDCSLRGAVTAANATAGLDIITFNIPAASCPAGVCRITLTDGPLLLSEAVELDATTQPKNGAPQANVCATASEPSYMRIEIITDPTSGGSTAFEFGDPTDASIVRGFAFGTDDGVGVESAVHPVTGAGLLVACNHFGLDAAGSAPLGVGTFFAAVLIDSGASGVIVGTDSDGIDDVAERNVFGGSTAVPIYINANSMNRISGNYFGFTADGAASLDVGSILVRQNSSSNLIGSNGDGVLDELERNYFGGSVGVTLQATSSAPTDNVVAGNTFGFTPSGVAVNIDTAIRLTDLDAGETGFAIRGNTFGSASTGLWISGNEAGASVLVADNTFGTASDGTGSYGNTFAIIVDGAGSPVIRNNDILNSTTNGIRLDGTAALGAGSIGNCLIGNGSGITNTTGSAVTFENNWWGVSSGPSGQGPGSGDTVGVDIDYTPWLNIAPTGCEAGPTFDDVPATDTFFDEIEWLAAQGITRGCNPPDNSLFCPNDSVTRGQMAALLRRALEGTLTIGETLTFVDIGGSVFASDIAWLGSVGVTRGCNPPDNDRFCPDDVVTRGQMATFLVRAFGYTAGAGSDRFADDDGLVFEADIERLAEAGVTLGCNPPINDSFCPDDGVTRAQMAAFLSRAIQP